MGTTQEELTRLSGVIGLIYEGATDPSRWTKDILPAVADYIQAPEGILHTSLHTPQNGGYFFLHGITQERVAVYINKYHDDDVWTRGALEKNLFVEGNVFTGDEAIPREQFLESKIYRELLSREENKNLGQLLTSVIFGLDETNSMPAVCSFFRGFHHPDFGEQDRARLRLLLPHLSRSLGVMQRLRSAELTMATTFAMLDHLPTGVLLVDATGEVTYVNHAAERMLESGEGLRLRKLTRTPGLGQLAAANELANRAIAAALHSTLSRDPYATEHFSDCVVVPQSSGGSAYTMQFSALGNQSEFGADGTSSAIVFLANGAHRVEVDPAALQRAYGLTPSEARVAIALLECSSAKEVADFLGTSFHTVRTQISSIYAKLGVDTRARFVKLMMGLARCKP